MTEFVLPHNLSLENKQKLSVSGVTDVDSFSESKIVLFTEDDTLIVDGDDLHIQKFDKSSGELIIDGEIYSLTYTGQSGKGSDKGFFKKIFK